MKKKDLRKNIMSLAEENQSLKEDIQALLLPMSDSRHLTVRSRWLLFFEIEKELFSGNMPSGGDRTVRDDMVSKTTFGFIKHLSE